MQRVWAGRLTAMQRPPPDPAAAAGRRPMLATFGGSNRQMLLDIRDSLSHVRKQPVAAAVAAAAVDGMQVKAEAVNGGEKAKQMPGRLGYNQKAMAEIRQSLQGFRAATANGLHQLSLHDEVRALQQHHRYL